MSNSGFGAERFVASLLASPSARSYNTCYTVHFIRPNRLTPTSYSPKPLCTIKLSLMTKRNIFLDSKRISK
jgi:hypothetical protein